MTAELKPNEPKSVDSNLSPHSQEEIDRVMQEVEVIQGQMQELATQKAALAPVASLESSAPAPVAQEVAQAAPERPKLSVVPPEEAVKLSGSEAKPEPEVTRPSFEVPTIQDPMEAMKEFAPESLGDFFDEARLASPAQSIGADRPASSSAQEQPSSVLSMSIQGSMAVHLNFGHQGESMLVKFSEDTVSIQLSSGTEIRIPRPSH